MGNGIEFARMDAPEHFKDQLLIVFLRRLKEKYGDDLMFPVAETDATGGHLVAFKIEDRAFKFELRKKS